jgi:Fe-S-cluster containining protein
VSPRYGRLARAVGAVYRRLDRRIAGFRRAAGLSCPRGCGECCLSPEVEATVLEMLPLALRLQRERRLEQTLAGLGPGEPPRPCVFYSPAPLGSFGGHCSVYPLRPLVCRLFGFAAMTDPEGRPQLVLCRRLREADPAGARKAAAGAASGRLPVPVMSEWSLAMYRLDPGLGTRALPINEALGQALERVALERRWRDR